MEHQLYDGVAQQDADQAVADAVEVPGRLESLDHADVEGERDLLAGVGDARAPEDDPGRDRGAGGDEQGERGDRLRSRDDHEDGEEAHGGADQGARDAQRPLLDGRALAPEADDQAGDETRPDSGPVDRAL